MSRKFSITDREKKSFTITDINSEEEELKRLMDIAEKEKEKEKKKKEKEKKKKEKEDKDFWDDLEKRLSGGKLQKKKQLKLPKKATTKAKKATKKGIK